MPKEVCLSMKKVDVDALSSLATPVSRGHLDGSDAWRHDVLDPWPFRRDLSSTQMATKKGCCLEWPEPCGFAWLRARLSLAVRPSANDPRQADHLLRFGDLYGLSVTGPVARKPASGGRAHRPKLIRPESSFYESPRSGRPNGSTQFPFASYGQRTTSGVVETAVRYVMTNPLRIGAGPADIVRSNHYRTLPAWSPKYRVSPQFLRNRRRGFAKPHHSAKIPIVIGVKPAFP